MTLSGNRIVVVVFCLLCSGAVGCGSNGPKMVPIHGQITYKGTPLVNVTQGIVRYTPKQSGTPARDATGRIQPDGSFVLTTLTKADGVVFGEYDISVSAYSVPTLTREQTEIGRAARQSQTHDPRKISESEHLRIE